MVLIDGRVIHNCGGFNGGQTRTCKVDLSTYAGVHEFRIMFDQTDDDNLGNGAIDNVRPVDNCTNASVNPNFSIAGPGGKDVDQTALFTASSSPDSAFAGYRWLVDGDFIAKGDSFYRSFENQGQHAVQLIASHCFGQDTVTKTFQATMPSSAPVSDFTASRTSIDASQKVVLTDQSTNNPSNWEWSISPKSNSPKDANFIYMNGSDATSQNPAVRFFEPGVYEICLTASNAAGSGNQECKSAFITVNQTITTNEDTMFVNNAQDTTWQKSGLHRSWAQFPSNTNRYRKILLQYTLGCTSNGCSEWDYTNKVEIVYPTGTIDTTIVLAPRFKVEGKRRDTFRFSKDTTWITYFNPTTNSTDSVPHPKRHVTLYNDPNHPQRVTGGISVYPANHTKNYYDSNGNIVNSKPAGADSTWMADDDTIYRTEPEEEVVEIARANTPYAGNFSSSWSRTWTYDVTEYAPVLANAREVRTYYRGNTSTGTFTIDLDFEMIKGIPPRDTREVNVLWKSPGTGQWYGYPEKPIDSFFVERSVDVSQQAANSMVRVSVNGHGFGGANNCSEFCPTDYFVHVNGQQRAQQQIWQNDCSMNPLFPQAGTWIYNRTNWCPGDRILPYDHEVTSYVNQSTNNTFDITMEPFTYDGGGTPSRWVFDAQLFTFSEPNFTRDASLKKIVAPNDNWYENRYNPRCDNPIIPRSLLSPWNTEQ
ncbi:MAG: hypothetical protein BRD50_07185 [Bacteroidetes bacterium SW_11_45_7]|nr:MAG: hypothetical protein BRD50_07185 [Bacteroidetes bacterium SW_11_45_7]